MRALATSSDETILTATTTGGEFNASFPIGNLKNAEHASSGAVEDAADASESYATTNPPTGGYPVTITLEFDGLASLEGFHLWTVSWSAMNASSLRIC